MNLRTERIKLADQHGNFLVDINGFCDAFCYYWPR